MFTLRLIFSIHNILLVFRLAFDDEVSHESVFYNEF